MPNTERFLDYSSLVVVELKNISKRALLSLKIFRAFSALRQAESVRMIPIAWVKIRPIRFKNIVLKLEYFFAKYFFFDF